MDEKKILLYYPGCSLKTYARDYEKTALEILRVLGFEVYELENWVCCGAELNLTRDFYMHHIGPIRSLIRAQQMQRKYGGNKLLTLCPLCYNVLAAVNRRLKEDKEFYDRVTAFMDEEEKYEHKIEVVHLVSILKEVPTEVYEEYTVNDLSKFRVAVYYGCKLARPKEIAIVDPEDPLILEGILKKLGATVVDWSHKTECCGAYLIATNKEAVKNAVEKIIDNAKENNANVIVTVCPLCHFNLTYVQKKLLKHHRLIPVLYVTELLTYAFGYQQPTKQKTSEVIKVLART